MEKGRSRLTVTAVANGPTNSGIRRSLASRPPYTASAQAVRLSLERSSREPSSLSDAGAAPTCRNGQACPVPPGSENRAKAHEGSRGTWDPRSSPPTCPAREPEYQLPGAHGRASRPLGANRAQGWYRQAKATKRGERNGRESERLIVLMSPGNHSEGPGVGKEAPCHVTVGGKHGGCIETRGRVHETKTDSETRLAKPHLRDFLKRRVRDGHSVCRPVANT
jgi:hypothetical protein